MMGSLLHIIPVIPTAGSGCNGWGSQALFGSLGGEQSVQNPELMGGGPIRHDDVSNPDAIPPAAPPAAPANLPTYVATRVPR